MSKILNSLKKLFRFLFNTSSTKSWDYYTFYTNLAKWQEANIRPTPQNLPHILYLDTPFWQNAYNLYQLTYKDKHEYELSCYLIDNDPVYTKVIRGQTNFVYSKHNLQVKYVPKQNGYYDKLVIFNGNNIFKKSIYKDKPPKQIKIVKLFSLHTHPPHWNSTQNINSQNTGSQNAQNTIASTPTNTSNNSLNTQATFTASQPIYYFFSATDINSLLSSKNLASGLITNKVYLVIKTNLVTLANIPQNTYITKDWLLDNNFVLYEGDFKEKKFVRYYKEKPV